MDHQSISHICHSHFLMGCNLGHGAQPSKPWLMRPQKETQGNYLGALLCAWTLYPCRMPDSQPVQDWVPSSLNLKHALDWTLALLRGTQLGFWLFCQCLTYPNSTYYNPWSPEIMPLKIAIWRVSSQAYFPCSPMGNRAHSPHSCVWRVEVSSLGEEIIYLDSWF